MRVFIASLPFRLSVLQCPEPREEMYRAYRSLTMYWLVKKSLSFNVAAHPS